MTQVWLANYAANIYRTTGNAEQMVGEGRWRVDGMTGTRRIRSYTAGAAADVRHRNLDDTRAPAVAPGVHWSCA